MHELVQVGREEVVCLCLQMRTEENEAHDKFVGHLPA